MVCNRCTPEQFDTLSDEELVELTLADCAPAFDALVERHHAVFRGTAMKLMKDQSDANDVVQTALLAIYEKLDTFAGRGSFAGWAYRIVRNTGLMEIRRRRRRRETDIDDAPQSAFEPLGYRTWSASPDRALRNKEIRRAVRLAVSQLEPKYRTAIELRELEGMSMAQMSERMGLSIGGVKTRLHRARAQMRVWLEDRYDISPGPVA